MSQGKDRRALGRDIPQIAGSQDRRPVMLNFRCIPISTEVGERWSLSGVDDSGNRLRRMVAEPRPAEPDGTRHNGTGAPCRHCLRDAEEGEELLLGSYRMPTSAGHLLDATIFVHAGPCQQFAQRGCSDRSQSFGINPSV